MTEDEAFVRAVVDHPGDDTPRLVYADWLDDRADPRGTYLRAEAEWAKPWREGQRPADSPELRGLATGLDPVWVARVSRPPLGVCCDHFVMENSGPTLSPEVLNQIEREYAVKFPNDYVAFLLNHNGGHPYPARAWLPKSAYPYPGDGYWFYPISLISGQPGERCLQFEIARYRNTTLPRFLADTSPPPEVDVRWYWSFVPICDPPDEIFTELLGVRGQFAGWVTEVDWSVEPCLFNRRRAAPSLAQYLFNFNPPAEFHIPDHDQGDAV